MRTGRRWSEGANEHTFYIGAKRNNSCLPSTTTNTLPMDHLARRRRKLAAAAAASGGDGGVSDCGGQEGQPPLMANSAPIHLQQDPSMTPKNFMLESAMSISGDVSRMSPFFADNVDQSQEGPYGLGSGEKLVVKKGKTRVEENHDKDERRRKKVR